MDFFEYASWAAVFVDTMWVQLLVGGLCFAIVFIFQGVALYVIATREGYRNRWMAFVPFFNTYYIGVCGQKNKFYNISARTIGLIAAILEAALFAGYLVYYIACALVSPYEIKTPTTNSFGYTAYEYSLKDYPASLAWAAWSYYYLYSYILYFVNLIYMLIEIFLFICFFQTYACRHYVLFTVTSVIFPVQGILSFIVRNNRGVSYRDYLKAEQARRYRAYQEYQRQNFENNPYNHNPYSQGYQAPPQGSPPAGSAPDDPFGDMGDSSSDGSAGSSSDSPFDDF